MVAVAAAAATTTTMTVMMINNDDKKDGDDNDYEIAHSSCCFANGVNSFRKQTVTETKSTH